MNEVMDVTVLDSHMRFLLEQAADAVIVVDQDDRIVGWNFRAECKFGWKKEDQLGKVLECLEFTREPSVTLRQVLLQHIDPVPGSPRFHRYRATAKRRSGEKFVAEVAVTSLSVGENLPVLCLHVRDRSAWQAELHEQREAKEHYRSLLESTAEAIYEVDLNGICTYCNAACARMLGYDSADELVGRSVQAVIRQRQADGNLVPFANTRVSEALHRGEGTYVEEDAFWTKSGQSLPVEYWSYPIRRDDEIVGVVVTFLDITERKEEALYRARLAALVESSYDAIISRDLEGRVTSWNLGAERIYGYREEEALNKTIDLVLPAHQTQEEPEVLRARQTGVRLEQFETIHRRKDGRLISVSLTLSPITDDAGNIIGTSSIVRDFTERKRNEEELRQAKEAAEQASRTRGEFLANVSHELRTPMNAIIGMTQLALGEVLSEEVQDYISTANDSAHSLLSLLNDILDFSKLEAGKFTVEKAPFDLHEMFDETVKSLSVRAFEKKLELAGEMGERVPEFLIGDKIRLRQVLTNLISNAVKFTEVGEVVVRVEVVRLWRSEAVLLFSVTDTGVGILPEDQQRIVEPFTQVDASATRHHGGTGLGLAICNELLRLMGSRLTIHSTPGQGSRFSFRMSFELLEEQSSNRRVPVSLAKLRKMPVLVVDDNESNLRIISKALSNWSLVPVTARSGAEGLKVFIEAQKKNKPFPLVIVDALMPEMDGYELSERIRKSTGQAPPVVLMVSSSDRRTSKDREATAGVAVCLQKPVSQSDLMDAIMRALQVELYAADLAEVEQEVTRETKPLSILLAEDTPANQKVALGILRKRGHHVTVAEDGQQVVEKFRQGEYDVILMDVQMPVMDGLLATVAIRKLEKETGQSVPIIAMTAHAMRGDRERCLQAGMDAYLSKPIAVHELLELVENARSKMPEPLSLTHPAVDPLPQPNGRGTKRANDLPIMDIDATLKRLDGDLELLQSFIGFFDEDYPQLWKTIERSAQAGNAEELHRAAHSLKGLAANFAAAPCVAAAHEVEMQAKNGDRPAWELSLPILKHELQRLTQALAKYRLPY